MQFFIETTDFNLIEKIVKRGALHGVVTTPSLLLKHDHPLQVIKDLLEAQPGAVVVDVLPDFDRMGSKIAAPSSRIVLRIPAIEQAWESIYRFSTNKVPVMVGAIFSPFHALLAATSGAAYAVPHLARMLKSGKKPSILSNGQLSGIAWLKKFTKSLLFFFCLLTRVKMYRILYTK